MMGLEERYQTDRSEVVYDVVPADANRHSARGSMYQPAVFLQQGVALACFNVTGIPVDYPTQT